MNKHQKMQDYHQSFIDENQSFTEETLVRQITEACEFAFANFQEPYLSSDKDDWVKIAYEHELATIGLRLSEGLKRVYPKLGKSEKVADVIVQVVENKAYSLGVRAYFLYALQNGKMDKQLAHIATTCEELW